MTPISIHPGAGSVSDGFLWTDIVQISPAVNAGHTGSERAAPKRLYGADFATFC